MGGCSPNPVCLFTQSCPPNIKGNALHKSLKGTLYLKGELGELFELKCHFINVRYKNYFHLIKKNPKLKMDKIALGHASLSNNKI